MRDKLRSIVGRHFLGVIGHWIENLTAAELKRDGPNASEVVKGSGEF